MSSQTNYCILRDGELIPATTLEWERWWFKQADERIVARSSVGAAEILTECLGIMPGSLFKTTITGGPYDGECERYDTLEAAMLGHERLFGRIEATC